MRPIRRFMSTRRIAVATSLTLIASVGLSLAAPSIAQAAPMIYRVDDDAGAVGDGSTWALAFDDLQDAFAVAGDGDEIWVAEGTYIPGTSTTDSFVLEHAVSLLGGFDGTEALSSQRQPDVNITILSGEIGAVGATDNIENIVTTAVGLSLKSAVVSGFTITRGYAPSFGGGVYQQYGYLDLDQLTITDNYAGGNGAGFTSRSVSMGATLIDSVVSANYGDVPGSGVASYGSAVAVLFGSGAVDIVDTVIEDNTVRGVFIVGVPTNIHNSVIQNNISASFSGGGISVNGADVLITNTKIVGNGNVRERD